MTFVKPLCIPPSAIKANKKIKTNVKQNDSTQ